MTLLMAVGAAVGGGIVGWWIARRSAATGTGAVARERNLVPDPALDWLRRVHGALGVWVAELDPEEEGPRAERLVDAERLSVAQIVAVDRRLERARDREQGGTELVDGGTLVIQAARGTAVGLLLPSLTVPTQVARAEDDLRRLLDAVRRRPQTVALVQARSREASFESAASVGLRLAYQVERMLSAYGLEAEIVVSAVEVGGVRIVGVSGRADRRLLNSVLPSDSDLARVARGELNLMSAMLAADPLGGVVADRRHRSGASVVLPIAAGDQPIGALMIWLPGHEALTDSARTEVGEALADAAPRLARALEGDKSQQVATVDPLTGLYNWRGLEECLARHKGRRGALITIDLDRFKALNDALGQVGGDAALVHVARLLREQLRQQDVPARLNGGSFAAWLPDAGLELGSRIAERLRIKISTTPWDWRGRAWPLAASFGVAACPETATTIEIIATQSDMALSVAKRSGRNRVEKAGPVPYIS